MRTACHSYYLSPEICENKPYNRKSDVWSLGCIAYELCTLQCPFNGRDMKALVLSILKGAYAPISTKFSEQMRALVGAMLTRDAAARPTVEQLLATPLMQGRMRAFLQIPITVPQQPKLVLPAKALPAPPEKPRTPAPQQKPRTPAPAPAPPVKAAAAAEDESVRELIAEQARVADQARRAAEEGKRRQAEAEKRRLQAETEKREVERRRLAEARLDEERKERERERKREAEAESARRRDEEKRRRDEARLDEERKERERRREAEAESARRRDEAEKRRLAERRQMEADRERARERLKAEAEQVRRSAQEEGGRLQLEDRVLAILQKRQASSGDEASGSRPSSAVAQPSDTDEAKLAPAAQTNAPADRTARILVARRQRRKEQSVHEGVPVAADMPPLADFGAAPSSARSERERAEAAQKERRASVGSAAVTPPSVQEIARRQFFMDQAAAKMNKQRAMADFQGNAAGLGLDLPSQAKPPLSTGQMEVLRLPEYPAGHTDRTEPRVAASAADAASSVTKVKDLKEKRKQNERLAMEAELASIRKQHFAEKREAAERLRRMAEAQHAQKDERARIGAPASAAAAPPSSSSADAATLQMRKQQREDARAALRAMIHSDRSRSQPGGSAATDACLSAQDLPKRVHLSLPPAESHTRLPKATHASLPEPRALEGNQGVSDEQSMSERLRMMAQQEGWSRRSVDGAPAPFTSAVAVIDVQQTDPPAVAMGTDDGDGAESETVEEIFQTAPQPGLFQIDEAESADFSAMLDEMRATLNPLSTAPAVADTDDVDEGNAQLPLTRFLHKNATLRITGAGEAQSAHHRIEALRNFLEHELGVRKFVQAYDIVKSTYHGADEPNSGERIGGILQSAELEYVSLIVQLIICEEGVYGQLSPAEAKGEMHRAICRLPQISTSISRPGQAGPLVT